MCVCVCVCVYVYVCVCVCVCVCILCKNRAVSLSLSSCLITFFFSLPASSFKLETSGSTGIVVMVKDNKLYCVSPHLMQSFVVVVVVVVVSIPINGTIG